VGQNNIIELNGKQYDAITGALLGESRVKATPAARATQTRRGRAIDGFTRSKTANLAPTVVKPSMPEPAASPVRSYKPHAGKKPDIQRAPKVIKAHQPERPQTLMRHAVSKPKTIMKPAIKTTAPAEMMAKPVSALTKQLEKKLSVTQVDPVRLARSKHVAKSHHIRRFSQARRQQSDINTAVRSKTQQHAAPQFQHAAPVRRVSHSVALAKAKQGLAAQQNSVDIFEAALAHAISHEQMPQSPAKHRRGLRKRTVNILAGAAAFLVIGGFVTYLSMPAIELKVASVRAGFHAEMPSYRPTGYALDGGIQSSQGKVAMNFRSGDSSFKITQEASDWNSATLLDQKVNEGGAPAQTIQSKGRIIYLDDNGATWVNGGVRYEISGNASLDADELVSLATSM
jgi:hypothetical protein